MTDTTGVQRWFWALLVWMALQRSAAGPTGSLRADAAGGGQAPSQPLEPDASRWGAGAAGSSPRASAAGRQGAAADTGSSFRELFLTTARRHGLDPALLWAVARVESGLNPHAVSPAGAMGLMQLMPGTARALGVDDPLDPAANLEAGARYLRQQLERFGDLRLALAAYNAGPSAVERYGGVPPYRETRAYVERVLDAWRRARMG